MATDNYDTKNIGTKILVGFSTLGPVAIAAVCVLNFVFTSSKTADQTFSTALASVGEIMRSPAMMRMSPMVYAPKSPIDKIDVDEETLDLSSDDEDERFALSTRTDDFTKGVDGRQVTAIHEIAQDYSMIIPASLSPVSDAAGVSMQIVDHSITEFFNQASVKDSFVGRAAETVEKTMKAEVEIGGSEPESIKHNIKFQVKAAETKASMEYRGLTNCDVSYSVSSRKTDVEIFEELARGSNLVFTHSDTPSDRRDLLSLRMHW